MKPHIKKNNKLKWNMLYGYRRHIHWRHPSKETLISMHALNIISLLYPDVSSIFLVLFVYMALYLWSSFSLMENKFKGGGFPSFPVLC